ALQGALEHAKAMATANPTHTAIVVLATDGLPESCVPQDIPSIAMIAAAGQSGTPKVLTFVIGVGTELANLNAIASAGGTTSAFIVDASQNVTMQFAQALNAIRTTAIACEYLIPPPSMGQIDFGLVNVQYTPGTGNPVLLSQVPSAASCDSAGGGWYYDNPQNPTKIILCSSTCTQLKKDPMAQIKILLGCKTMIVPA